MPDGIEEHHRIRTWREFRKFVADHREHADNVSIDAAHGDVVHVRVRE